MRSENVPESPSSALQTTYFCSTCWSSTVFHLMPVGNAAPPRPRKPGVSDFLHHLRTGHAQRALQALVAAMRHVLVEIDRIDDADARKGQAFLAGDVGKFFDHAQAQRMLRALQHAGVQQRPDLRSGHRSIADALAGDFHFDQGLEPDHAARTDAHQLDFGSLAAGQLDQRSGRLVGAQCERGGIPRYIHARHLRARHSFMSSSKRVGVTRP